MQNGRASSLVNATIPTHSANATMGLLYLIKKPFNTYRDVFLTVGADDFLARIRLLGAADFLARILLFFLF